MPCGNRRVGFITPMRAKHSYLGIVGDYLAMLIWAAVLLVLMPFILLDYLTQPRNLDYFTQPRKKQ